MKKFYFFLFILIFAACKNQKNIQISIIPKPLYVSDSKKIIRLNKKYTIYLHSKNTLLKQNAIYLKKRIETALKNSKISIKQSSSVKKNGIHFILNEKFDTTIGNEGYIMTTGKNTIIRANTPAGIFYGIQTFLQLLPPKIYSDSASDFNFIIPKVKIIDKPRYSYRGMHLDVSRHFFPISVIKKYIDYLAYHKLNKFHWHLTDDQGWRIEIKKYPKLTTIASKRSGTQLYGFKYLNKKIKYDTIAVNGFYTQKQIKDIIDYAKKRYIEVIPEIEMPGHSQAALAAYPQLSCTGGPFKVMRRFGVSKEVFCAGNDSVFVFLDNIIDEIADLFPSKYIHIGGDECPKDRWKKCPKCQKRIKQKHLKDETQLQSWFIKKIEKHINKKGKILIGWSEILDGGIAPNAVLESWIGVEGGIKAAKQKHYVIMSPTDYLYFDGIYVRPVDKKMEPYGQTYCWTNCKKIYSFNPTPDSLAKKYQKYFLGAEATMWTEFISKLPHLQYMLMPRIDALSEICWTQDSLKNFNDFEKRMNTQYLRYDAMNINYRIPTPIINDTIYLKKNNKIIIKNPSNCTTIRYTLDGSNPTTSSNKYSKPLIIKQNCILKSACFNKKNRRSSIVTSHIIVH